MGILPWFATQSNIGTYSAILIVVVYLLLFVVSKKVKKTEVKKLTKKEL